MSKKNVNQTRKQVQANSNASSTSSTRQVNGKSTNITSSKQGQTTKPDLPSKAEGTATTRTNDASSKQGQTTKPGQMPSKAGVTAATKLHRPGNKPLTRQAMKYERRMEEQQRRAAQQRRAVGTRRIVILSVVAVVVCASVLVTYFVVQARQARSTTANQCQGTVFDPNYQPIDCVYCDQLEQSAYHHHVHLTAYIDGNVVTVPQSIGIATAGSGVDCYYWLHTHATDGIIHVEAPNAGTFTLKDFLDIWQSFAASNSSQISYSTQLASSAGWIVYINGKKVNQDFSKVDISSDQAWHEAITIMYNSPNAKPDTSYNWQSGY